MAAPPTKPALRDELLARLSHELDEVERAHRSAIEGATHEEARNENSKDTRALEQSYLARGQAMRVDELRRAVAEVSMMTTVTFAADQPVAPGALVTADEDDARQLFYVALHGGGATLANATVLVVTPASPLGRALAGRRVGDVCEFTVAGRRRELEIVSVA